MDSDPITSLIGGAMVEDALPVGCKEHGDGAVPGAGKFLDRLAGRWTLDLAGSQLPQTVRETVSGEVTVDFAPDGIWMADGDKNACTYGAKPGEIPGVPVTK